MSRGFQTAEVNWISCNGIVAPGAQNVKSERCRSDTCFVGGGIFFRAPGHTDREYTAKEMEAYAGDRPHRADPCDHRRAQLGLVGLAAIWCISLLFRGRDEIDGDTEEA